MRRSLMFAQLAAMSLGMFAAVTGSTNLVPSQPRKARKPVKTMAVSSRPDIAAWNAKVEEKKETRRIARELVRPYASPLLSRRQQRRARSAILRGDIYATARGAA